MLAELLVHLLLLSCWLPTVLLQAGAAGPASWLQIFVCRQLEFYMAASIKDAQRVQSNCPPSALVHVKIFLKQALTTP